MIPQSVFESIYRQGYNDAKYNRQFRFLGSDHVPEPNQNEVDAAFTKFQEQYPLMQWNQRVIEFVGDPDKGTDVRVMPSEAVSDWKPACVLARDCGKLHEVIEHPERLTQYASGASPEVGARTVSVDGEGLPDPFDSGELTFRVETEHSRPGHVDVEVDLVSFEAEGDLTDDFTLELEGTFDG